MNNHQKGYRRDRAVIETLQDWGTMDTEQLRILFYHSARVAQRRLKILTAKGKIKRFHEVIGLPYIYSLSKPDNVRLTLNWLRIWLVKRLKSWEVIETFDYETNTCIIKNTVQNTIKTYNFFYNAFRKTWLNGGETIIIYDNEDLRREAAKSIKGMLVTVEEIKEGLKC